MTIIAVVTVLTALSVTFCVIALIWLLVGEKHGHEGARVCDGYNMCFY